MSPATKSKQREVERSDKAKVPISTRGDRVLAVWDCQTRSFTVDDLRHFIEHVDITLQSDVPMSLEWQDSDGLTFWVRVKGGKLFAAQRVVYDAQLAHKGSAHSVSWAQLKRAFQATIAEMAKD